MVWLLAGRAQDLNGRDTKGRMSLHHCHVRGRPRAAEVLIVLGAKVRIPTARRGHLWVVE